MTNLVKFLCYGSQGMRFGFSWLPWSPLLLVPSSCQRPWGVFKQPEKVVTNESSPQSDLFWSLKLKSATPTQTQSCLLTAEKRQKPVDLDKKLDRFWSKADGKANPQTPPSEYRWVPYINKSSNRNPKRPHEPVNDCSKMKLVVLCMLFMLLLLRNQSLHFQFQSRA